MKKEEKIFVQNFATLRAFDGGDKIKIIKDEDGNEKGFELRGRLTEFGVRNANGYNFDKSSYDKFVESYLEPNHFNIPANIKHKSDDFQHVAGKVVEMTKSEDGVDIVVRVPRWAYAYGWIKNAVQDGVLQAFSNFGPITDGSYDPETDTINVKAFDILHVALVELPGDVTSKFQAQNTVFKGFEKQQNGNSAERTEAEETVIDNEVNPDGWQW